MPPSCLHQQHLPPVLQLSDFLEEESDLRIDHLWGVAVGVSGDQGHIELHHVEIVSERLLELLLRSQDGGLDDLFVVALNFCLKFIVFSQAVEVRARNRIWDQVQRFVSVRLVGDQPSEVSRLNGELGILDDSGDSRRSYLRQSVA